MSLRGANEHGNNKYREFFGSNQFNFPKTEGEGDFSVCLSFCLYVCLSVSLSLPPSPLPPSLAFQNCLSEAFLLVNVLDIPVMECSSNFRLDVFRASVAASAWNFIDRNVSCYGG